MSNKKTQALDTVKLATFYMIAKERVIEAGFADEIDWQADVSIEDCCETTFLREAAWVVLSSGFREDVVRSRFPRISAAFLNWSSAAAIITQGESCRSNALRAFGNARKIDAIFRIAQRVASDGIETIRQALVNRGTEFLQELPFIGPVTACHLGKNLGLPISKADRHLVRFAEHSGYPSVDEMCLAIHQLVDDSIAVIDLVLWRYATISRSYDMGCIRAECTTQRRAKAA